MNRGILSDPNKYKHNQSFVERWVVLPSTSQQVRFIREPWPKWWSSFTTCRCLASRLSFLFDQSKPADRSILFSFSFVVGRLLSAIQHVWKWRFGLKNVIFPIPKNEATPDQKLLTKRWGIKCRAVSKQDGPWAQPVSCVLSIYKGHQKLIPI